MILNYTHYHLNAVRFYFTQCDAHPLSLRLITSLESHLKSHAIRYKLPNASPCQIATFTDNPLVRKLRSFIYSKCCILHSINKWIQR
jgi:hypothetical protein